MRASDRPARVFSILASLLATAAGAQSPDVPPALRDWIPWVLHESDTRACPLVGERRLCSWPGRLELVVDADGARFEQSWRVYADSSVPLPGNDAYWPQDVSVDGRPATVVASGGLPSLHLTPGQARVRGRIEWSRRPESLAVPQRIGLINLQVDGRTIHFPEREGGALWLGPRREAAPQRETVRLNVYRQLADGMPQTLVTHLQLAVTGRAREVQLPPVLPAGFVPMALDGNLPAQLDQQSGLALQLRPGTWHLSLTARAASPVNETGPPVVAFEGWPETEIWSYRAAERLRATTVEGGRPVDPAQSGVPQAWHGLPAFRLSAPEALGIVERSRGPAAAEPAQLGLSRELWLDFDGGGLTALDTLQGEMHAGWRLDMAPPYRLEMARSRGENLMITTGAADGSSGVELRDRELQLEAIARLPAGGELPVTGWQTAINGVHVTLHLPPGHRLIAAPGADEARGAWLAEWRLLDLFLVLIVTVALWKTIGPICGIAALVLLALSYQEPGAPAWSWLLLNLLAALVLARAAPEGRLRRWAGVYRNVALALTLLLALPFAAEQARLVLYPQLERYAAARPVPTSAPPGASAMKQRRPEVEEHLVTAEALAPTEDEADGARPDAAGPRHAADMQPERELPRYAADALVQSGPGIPAWQWHNYALRWDGPVSTAEHVRYVVAGSLTVRLLRVAMLIALALVAAALVRACLGGPEWRWPRAAAPSVLAWLALLAAPWPATGQTPDPALLEELKKRLLAPPDCAPDCVEIARARITAAAAGLAVRLEVHAGAAVAVPLPGRAGHWQPQEIYVDGRPTDTVLSRSDGRWLAVEAGRHELRLLGALPPVDSVQIDFPQRPHTIEIAALGDWQQSGIVDGRLTTGSLTLSRVREGQEGASGFADAGRFPSYVEVRRTLVFELDWRVRTMVERIAPQGAPITLAIPLLDGEAVLTPGVDVEDGRVAVAMAADQPRFFWNSTLDRSERLELVAAPQSSWHEVWTIVAGYLWHVQTSGTPAIDVAEEAGLASPQFRPWPGERLVVEASRPAATEGQTIAIDTASLYVTTGERAREASLALDYRATRGAQRALVLPSEAELLEARADGEVISLELHDGVLALPIDPGAHRYALRWREPGGMATGTRLPDVDLGGPASNLSLGLALPADRWVLAAWGPQLGPAVLYWAELAVFVAVALLLGRLGRTPLRARHWLLLGLGFSTFSWFALVLFGGWLFAMAWRAQRGAQLDEVQFNFVQVLLALFALVALAGLVVAIHTGLLGSPDMHIVGNASSAGELRWFVDRIDNAVPAAGAWSISLWWYKVAILAWALWISFALVRWLPWAWRCYATGGLWRPRDKRAPTPGTAGLG